MVKKGEWVQVHQVVLEPWERTARLPEDTSKCPVELWVKGFLVYDCEMNNQAVIKTLTGRIVKGELVAVNPGYEYGFGDEFVPEVLQIGIQLRELLRAGDEDER